MKNRIFTLLLVLGTMTLSAQTAIKVINNGFVGIGKSDPVQQLDVGGNVIIPNNQFYLSFRGDGTTSHQVFGMDSNNDIIFNRSAIVHNATSGLAMAATKFIDFRNQSGTVLMRMRPDNGRMGIGTNSPTHALTLGAGDAAKPGGGEWVATSDQRAKKNIRSFDAGLAEVLQIQPKYFQYNGKYGTQDSGKDHIGVMAQDMEEIAPFTVASAEFQDVKTSYSNARGTVETFGAVEKYLTFDGSSIKYMLVNAIKEQQEQIDALRQDNIDLQDKLNKLLEVNEVEGYTQSVTIRSAASLDQNSPNPFNGRTSINYYIPSFQSSASLVIADMNGKVLKTVAVDQAGPGTLEVNIEDYPNGQFSYRLVVDGNVVDTKKMVLVR